MLYLAPRSLQGKLALAFSAVVMVALVLSSAAFVVLRRGEQQRQAIDRVFSETPSLYADFSLLQFGSRAESQVAAFTGDAARRYDVRVLVVNSAGIVVGDSEGSLAGLPLPASSNAAGSVADSPYQVWEPDSGPAGDYVLLGAAGVAAGGLIATASSSGTITASPGAPTITAPYSLVLGVPRATIANAWLDLLPGLAIAGGFAFPVAILLAFFIARHVTRPLQQLTSASERLAGGSFDVTVPIGRTEM